MRRRRRVQLCHDCFLLKLKHHFPSLFIASFPSCESWKLISSIFISTFLNIFSYFSFFNLKYVFFLHSLVSSSALHSSSSSVSLSSSSPLFFFPCSPSPVFSIFSPPPFLFLSPSLSFLSSVFETEGRPFAWGQRGAFWEMEEGGDGVRMMMMMRRRRGGHEEGHS